ncbi:superoxide dismutase [Tenuifilum thalassicum]|uniref:Superoxide dismutase n=1 Tax=Tenuifilum thalassicum TaxID=2590900 RepID=A0A7D4BZ03_9BACT|nr:superoxide dismutase [Tenuifilum thalassicum]QKG79384.1 superoxide dismutase [Tenuifilum thalassicum]
MAFQLPKLKYDYKALEPYIDAMTMDIHYNKHHGGYTNNLNNAIAGSSLESLPIEEILKDASKHSAAVRNNGGGFYNHTLFWDIMGPNGGGSPSGELLKQIEKHFGSFDEFKETFSNAAATRFGSGWAWLVWTGENLKVFSTPNQDNPLMDVVDIKGTPILGLDVWEHAYYLKYQNRRPEYIQNFWNVIDWKSVEEKFIIATSK